MRLYEFVDEITDKLITILMLSAGRADSQNSSQQLLYTTLKTLLNTNMAIDQDTITKLSDDNPVLKELITGIHPEGITLNTKFKEPENTKDAPMEIPGGRSVEQMASRAAGRRF